MAQCNNPTDITGNDIEDWTKLNEDLIVLISENTNVYYCYRREEFYQILKQELRKTLTIWTQNGRRIEYEPLIKEPYVGYFIDKSILAYKNFQLLYLYKRGDFRIGSRFGVSNIHGAVNSVYSCVPIKRLCMNSNIQELRAEMANYVRANNVKIENEIRSILLGIHNLYKSCTSYYDIYVNKYHLQIPVTNDSQSLLNELGDESDEGEEGDDEFVDDEEMRRVRREQIEEFNRFERIRLDVQENREQLERRERHRNMLRDFADYFYPFEIYKEDNDDGGEMNIEIGEMGITPKDEENINRILRDIDQEDEEIMEALRNIVIYNDRIGFSKDITPEMIELIKTHILSLNLYDHLEFYNCSEIETLSDLNIAKLDVRGCSNIKTIESMGCTELICNNCHNLEEIKNCDDLETLILDNCDNFEKIDTFINLESLDISYCNKIQRIGNLPNCKKIKLQNSDVDFEHLDLQNYILLENVEFYNFNIRTIKIGNIRNLDCGYCNNLEKIEVETCQSARIIRCPRLRESNIPRENITECIEAPICGE